MNQEHHAATKPAPHPEPAQYPKEEVDSLGQHNPAWKMERDNITRAKETSEKNLKESKAKEQEGEHAPFKHSQPHEKVDYEAQTVVELKELAKERNVEISWDARKDEIISALEKDDKKRG